MLDAPDVNYLKKEEHGFSKCLCVSGERDFYFHSILSIVLFDFRKE